MSLDIAGVVILATPLIHLNPERLENYRQRATKESLSALVARILKFSIQHKKHPQYPGPHQLLTGILENEKEIANLKIDIYDLLRTLDSLQSDRTLNDRLHKEDAIFALIVITSGFILQMIGNAIQSFSGHSH